MGYAKLEMEKTENAKEFKVVMQYRRDQGTKVFQS